MYIPASPYVLSHCILDKEHARVHLEDVEYLQSRKFLTYLFDGWEDSLRRSLYGSVAAEVKQFPIILSLDNMTGKRGNVPTLVEMMEKATNSMDIGDMRNFVAVTTDNPTTMQAYRCKLQEKYWWLLVNCFEVCQGLRNC